MNYQKNFYAEHTITYIDSIFKNGKYYYNQAFQEECKNKLKQ